MHIKTTGYLVKEGLFNIFKNFLMSIASISIIILCLIIFGSFALATININYILDQIEDQQQIQAFISNEMNEEDKQKLKEEIQQFNNVESITIETKEQALNNFKNQIGEEKSEILDGFEEDNPLRDSYIISLNDISYTKDVVKKLESINGIVNVRSAVSVIEKLEKTMGLIHIINYTTLAALGAIAIFIISNTIRLTVFARRREISIMKFVGATDWFIRWPFIIEGMIIGLIGGILSTIITYLGYSYLINIIRKSINFFDLINISEIINYAAVLFCLFGILIGAIGSGVAVKKHLKV